MTPQHIKQSPKPLAGPRRRLAWMPGLLRRRTRLVVAPSPDICIDPRRSDSYRCGARGASLLLSAPPGQSLSHGWNRLHLRLHRCDPAKVQLTLRCGDNSAPTTALQVSARHHQTHLYFIAPNATGPLRLDVRHIDARPVHVAALWTQRISSHEALTRYCWAALRRQPASPQGLYNYAGQLWHALRRGGIGHAITKVQAKRHGAHYKDWIETCERPRVPAHADIVRATQQMARPPLISVVMPVYNSDETFLRRAIASVTQQSYPHWQLCIADDCSTEPHITPILAAAAAADARIKVFRRTKNGHICAASNDALAMCTGTFVALLDHDDELAPHALYRVAREIQDYPAAQLIYSDEDKLDANGTRRDPYFKPDYNHELLLGQNFISHLGVYRRKLLQEVGGFRPGLDGSQDYDLVLRVIEKIAPHKIRHIPEVLYHWRAVPGSVALSNTCKPYAYVAAEKALKQHLRRLGEKAEVVSLPVKGLHRVRFALPVRLPRVSIIIPTRDRVDLLERMVRSVVDKTSYKPYEIIIVDNQTRCPQTLAYLAELRQAGIARVFSYDAPFSFSRICNVAVQKARGALVVFCNNDLEVLEPNWLHAMARHAIRADVGAVGPRLLYPNQTVQHAGVILGVGGIASHAHKHSPATCYGYFGRAQLTQQYSAVTGACAMIRRSLFLKVGGFDEALAVAYNDVDLCLRLHKRGWRNIFTADTQLVHHESATRGSEMQAEHADRFAREMALMQKRWGHCLRADPFYSPNLSLNNEAFALNFEPPKRCEGIGPQRAAS